MAHELKDLEAIKSLLADTYDKVVIDNDFERAYSMPLQSFKDADKEDLIEILYLFLAIMDENDIDLDMVLGPSES